MNVEFKKKLTEPFSESVVSVPGKCPFYDYILTQNQNLKNEEKVCLCRDYSKKKKKNFIKFKKVSDFLINFYIKTYDEIIQFNKKFFSKDLPYEHIFPKQQRLFECPIFQDYSTSHTVENSLNEKLIVKMSDFLSIFLMKKKSAIQNDHLKLYLLDTTKLRIIVNFKNILTISNYKFTGDILAKNVKYSEFYSNLLEFFYIYYLKKEFYMYDDIKSLDLERTNPIYRYISQLKNKIFYENFQENYLERKKTDKKNMILELIKVCLDKFIPNMNELYNLNNSKPHVFILKIVHFVYKYRIISEEDSNSLIDLLRDKMNLLQTYEIIWNNYWNQLKSKKNSANQENSLFKKDEQPKLQENELIFWSEILIKIRQLYSQILILYIFFNMDKNMVNILNDFEPNKIIFDNTNNEILIDKDKKLIKEIENKINFEKLEFFQEENGKILMRVFFNYILVNYENSLIKINYKICEMSKIFLNLFSNVTDINLNSLKLLNSTTEIFLKKMKLLIPNSNLNVLEEQEKIEKNE